MTENATSKPITADGVLEHRDRQAVIHFERRIEHPIERVWAAITEPGQMLGWWGEAEVELVEGGRFVVEWLNREGDDEVARMEAIVTELDAPRLLQTEGGIHGALRWELEPDGESTRLRFTATGELPEDFETKNLAGWHTHLDALVTVLDGGSVDLVEIEILWKPVHEAYLARGG